MPLPISFMQKLNERKAMMAKGKFKEGERDMQVWKSLMTIEIMSSDESGEEEGEEILLVHALPWLSETVTQFKMSLDHEIISSRTPQARRQMKKRLTGCPSKRPVFGNLPTWAIKTVTLS